jgi:hypothetical protein
MNRHLLSLAIAGLLAVATASPGQEEKVTPRHGYPVRVDVVGRVKDSPMTVKRQHGPQGRSAGAYFQEATWRKDYQEDFLTCSFPAETTDWQEGAMTFIPGATGKVTLTFRGRLEKDEFGNHVEHWALVDGIRLDGAAGENLDFEGLDGKGKPTGWQAGPSLIVNEGAKSGTNAIRIWFQTPVTQEIAVEAGKPVTVTFWYRPSP